MEKKRNIIWLTGRDSYGRGLYEQKIRTLFEEKHGKENSTSYALSDIRDYRELVDRMNTIGLFSTHRLFIFRGKFTVKKGDSEEETEPKLSKKGRADEQFLLLLENFHEDTTALLSGVEIPGTLKLAKWLETYANKKVFDAVFDADLWHARFADIDHETVQDVLRNYRSRFDDEKSLTSEVSYEIGSTLEKLSLLALSQPLSKTDIEWSISGNFGQNIFTFSDAILRGDTHHALRVFHEMLGANSIYAFIPQLIGVLRANIYGKYLREKNISLHQIETLGLSKYSLEKGYAARISWQKLRDFYGKLLATNIAYKSGKGLYSPELGRIFEIERAILALKI